MDKSVLIVVTSIKNPFLEAWIAAFKLHSESVGVLLLGPESPGPAPVSVMEALVAADEMPDRDLRAAVERLLGGPPDTIFYWWGLHSASDPRPARIWPSAKRALCVDTYPNASRLLTELREVLRGTSWLSRIDCLVTTSVDMTEMLQLRFPHLRRRQWETIVSPFPISAHAGEQPASPADGPPRLIFTGRSDFLYSGSTKMAKDDPSLFFEGLLARSFRIYVQHPGEPRQAHRLLQNGYDLYPHFDRAALLDGTFSNFLSTFDGNLVYYATSNATLRRRVSNSLSTRFASALCAPSPLIVPHSASFATSLFRKYPIGVSSSSPEEVEEYLPEGATAARDSWTQNHHDWSAEGQIDTLGRVIG